MDERAQIADELAEICRQIDAMRRKHLHIVPGQAGDALTAKAATPAVVRQRQKQMRVVKSS